MIQYCLTPLLRSHKCVLSILNLFGCNIGLPGLSRLTDGLQRNDTVTSLNIGFNQLHGPQSAENVRWIIANCPQIQKLDISLNKFGPRGMTSILSALCQHQRGFRSHLESINLSQCGITMIQSSSDIHNPRMLEKLRLLIDRKDINLKEIFLDQNVQKHSLAEIIQQHHKE